jgi:hypothetical protein
VGDGVFVVPGWFWAKIAATAISTKNMSVAVLRIKSMSST